LGEGWGLVNTEHAASGRPQLVPNHTSLKEIFNEVPRISIESWETDRNYGLERGQVSTDHLAELLTTYYENRDLMEEDGQWCYDRIHEEQFSWEHVTKTMLGYISELLKPAEKIKPEFKGFGAPVKVN